MLSTLKELRENVATTTRELQINSLIDTYINLSLQEVNDPAWAFEQVQAFRGYNHLWTFNRRYATLPVMKSLIYLPRDCDKVNLLLYYGSGSSNFTKLSYLPDDSPDIANINPNNFGSPLYYRRWEEEGVSVSLTTNDRVTVVSSSGVDVAPLSVSIVGYSPAGYIQSEVLTLNGAVVVNGTLTYAEDRPLKISKSGKTTGQITVAKFTAPLTVLVVLGPEERTTRFKMVGVYPYPDEESGSITAFANSIVDPGVKTLVTSPAHGLADADEVLITLSPIYNGTYTITNVTTNTFDISIVFVAEAIVSQRWDKIIYNLYLEYFTRIRQLVNDSDVPDIDEKWLWVVRLGAVAKVYQYQNKETMFISAQAQYASGLRSMVKSDMQESDYIPVLRSHKHLTGVVKTADDSFSLTI
ncbi:MAG: hypothetical protein V1709_11775 [Planctomycetota bacterium]